MNIDLSPNGDIELRLSDNPDHFLKIAGWVHNTLNGHWRERLNGLDQSYWDLDVLGTTLTVHGEHFLGVSVIGADNDATRAMLLHLKNEFTSKYANPTIFCEQFPVWNGETNNQQNIP